ncbi:GNAT superfamily N-acetyltransferase [Kitasatospora sp. MAP12-15]|uniref:GNAT family N-acetyltransferase n=1 Tax=unclassified Kitasatospora TaxID=2633591 RepID=UPI002473082A|nr:GNAT family N-acetyltransferase [Kitasatospora sp. MAP12-44]MDH6112557.1 GNAT superfamily N-acetyltransferase [Kitasatospora sp. MAP12-44]
MTWTLSTSLDEYTAAAGEFLAAYPAQNTVLLTIADHLAAGESGGGSAGGEARFGWWRPAAGGPVRAAFAQTPPQLVQLGQAPVEAAAELARALAGERTTDRTTERAGERMAVPGVGGEAAAAEAFAAAWVQVVGGSARRVQRLRLYRLGALKPPVVAGQLRRADPEDRELLIGWTHAFADEVSATIPDVAAAVDRRLSAGNFHLWEVGGRTVAFAGLSSALAGMVRVGPVFTLPEQRGRGYGSAVTAAVSTEALRRGASEVLLYADLANPTSNSIYQQIGYREVEDRVVIAFDAE